MGGGHVQAAQRDTVFDGVNWFQAEWLMGASGFRRNGPPSLPEMLGATVFRRQSNFRNMRKPHEHDVQKYQNVFTPVFVFAKIRSYLAKSEIVTVLQAAGFA